MEGCKTIFGGDKGRERLREICLTGPVRTGWKEQMGKKTYHSNGKMYKEAIYDWSIIARIFKKKKKTSVWSHQTQTPKIVISLVFRLMGGQPFSPCD